MLSHLNLYSHGLLHQHSAGGSVALNGSHLKKPITAGISVISGGTLSSIPAHRRLQAKAKFERGLRWSEKETADLLRIWSGFSDLDPSSNRLEHSDRYTRLTEAMAALGHKRSRYEVRTRINNLRGDFRRMKSQKDANMLPNSKESFYQELEQIFAKEQLCLNEGGNMDSKHLVLFTNEAASPGNMSTGDDYAAEFDSLSSEIKQEDFGDQADDFPTAVEDSRVGPTQSSQASHRFLNNVLSILTKSTPTLDQNSGLSHDREDSVSTSDSANGLISSVDSVPISLLAAKLDHLRQEYDDILQEASAEGGRISEVNLNRFKVLQELIEKLSPVSKTSNSSVVNVARLSEGGVDGATDEQRLVENCNKNGSSSGLIGGEDLSMDGNEEPNHVWNLQRSSEDNFSNVSSEEPQTTSVLGSTSASIIITTPHSQSSLTPSCSKEGANLGGQQFFTDSTNGKVNERWSELELDDLLQSFGEITAERELTNTSKDSVVYDLLVREMEARGHDRTKEEIRNRINNLKADYRKYIRRMVESGGQFECSRPEYINKLAQAFSNVPGLGFGISMSISNSLVPPNSADPGCAYSPVPASLFSPTPFSLTTTDGLAPVVASTTANRNHDGSISARSCNFDFHHSNRGDMRSAMMSNLSPKMKSVTDKLLFRFSGGNSEENYLRNLGSLRKGGTTANSDANTHEINSGSSAADGDWMFPSNALLSSVDYTNVTEPVPFKKAKPSAAELPIGGSDPSAREAGSWITKHQLSQEGSSDLEPSSHREGPARGTAVPSGQGFCDNCGSNYAYLDSFMEKFLSIYQTIEERRIEQEAANFEKRQSHELKMVTLLCDTAKSLFPDGK